MATHHNTADGIPNSLHSTNLADLLERLLDKGIVIAGDIKINLVEVELLTIQIRLIICSVDKAREMGLEWWTNNPAFMTAPQPAEISDSIGNIERRLNKIESAIEGARQSDAD
ncbi:gas vesicle protein [Solidesulfovibrio sp. C21]|uniref:gas vesicle protein n=1 Tax=Solidesulfovibrio sp. C21 TaxID=3398613 RepID=UPI0039FBCEA2